jgi:hypothetical protein
MTCETRTPITSTRTLNKAHLRSPTQRRLIKSSSYSYTTAYSFSFLKSPSYRPNSNKMASQSAITFPSHFTPGTTSAFVSNEIFARDLTSTQIWALLANISKWPSYYKNCAKITRPESDSTFLHKGDVFKFSTFGFPPLTCEVVESEAPESNGRPGRLAWRCKEDGGVEVYHAWLVEDVEGQRVRVLTQESQIGDVFAQWDKERPNKMCMFFSRVGFAWMEC